MRQYTAAYSCTCLVKCQVQVYKLFSMYTFVANEPNQFLCCTMHQMVHNVTIFIVVQNDNNIIKYMQYCLALPNHKRE